jgi:hypothetical protein
MTFDHPPFLTRTAKDPARTLDANLLGREIGADAEGRTRPALALLAMARGHKGRLTGDFGPEISAAATCDPGHGHLLVVQPALSA